MPKSRGRKQKKIQKKGAVTSNDGHERQLADEYVNVDTAFGPIRVKSGKKKIINHGPKQG